MLLVPLVGMLNPINMRLLRYRLNVKKLLESQHNSCLIQDVEESNAKSPSLCNRDDANRRIYLCQH